MTVETEVALLKQDVVNILELFSKLDIAIAKFSDVSSNINKLLAVHEERIHSNEKQTGALEKSMAKLETDIERDIKELHSRITTTTREITTDLGETEKRITDAIREIKTELYKERDQVNSKNKALEERISSLEKWRWVIMGGATVVGFLIAKLFPAFNIIAK